MPNEFPSFQDNWTDFKNLTFKETAARVLSPFLAPDIPEESLQEIVDKALNFDTPLKKVGNNYILELFHGPTLAFKDVAAQVLARLMEYYLEKEKRKMTLLVATSGDTGGAVAQAYANIEGIKVFILYPKDKVSSLQEEQLTHVAHNIFPLEINGTFDDCQNIVKKVFLDPSLKRLNITTANSINVGRLLPQLSYYAYAASRIPQKTLRFVVPSGNMGNITAGLIAKKCKIPIDSFIIACNANRSVVNYMNNGKYSPQKAKQTLSNAMDIGAPSNFERIQYLYNNNVEQLRQVAGAISISDKKTKETIKRVYKEHSYILDPHTAVAWAASENIQDDTQNVILSTASPAKFKEEIRKATGISVPQNHQFTNKYPQKKYNLPSDYETCIKHIDTLAKV